jgi:hypothetical protein
LAHLLTVRRRSASLAITTSQHAGDKAAAAAETTASSSGINWIASLGSPADGQCQTKLILGFCTAAIDQLRATGDKTTELGRTRKIDSVEYIGEYCEGPFGRVFLLPNYPVCSFAQNTSLQPAGFNVIFTVRVSFFRQEQPVLFRSVTSCVSAIKK